MVWHHSCGLHGEGEGRPCDPPCDDPWQVDTPDGWGWIRYDTNVGSFATLPEAMDFAQKVINEPSKWMEQLP